MAMSQTEIERMIREAFPDARVEVKDLAGDGNHYSASVVSSAFKGVNKVKQHQMVYAALKGKMGGELHALALTTSESVNDRLMRLSDCHNFHDFRQIARSSACRDRSSTISTAPPTTRRPMAKYRELRGLRPSSERVVRSRKASNCPSPSWDRGLPFRSTARRRPCSAFSTTRASGRSPQRRPESGRCSVSPRSGTISLDELRKAYDAPQVYQIYSTRTAV